jgi:hypothetical protein
LEELRSLSVEAAQRVIEGAAETEAEFLQFYQFEGS